MIQSPINEFKSVRNQHYECYMHALGLVNIYKYMVLTNFVTESVIQHQSKIGFLSGSGEHQVQLWQISPLML